MRFLTPQEFDAYTVRVRALLANHRRVTAGRPHLHMPGAELPQTCRRGHAFTPETTRLRKRGGKKYLGGKLLRECKVCARMKQRERNARRQNSKLRKESGT